MTSNRKRIWGWMAYDWASQPFYPLGLTFIFAPYFASLSVEYFNRSLNDFDAAKAASQSLWFWGQTFSGLFIAFSGPIIGAFADSTGRRRPWIVTSSIIYVLASATLWFTMPDASTLFLMLIVFNIGFIAVEYLLIFTNAYLPSLGDDETVGKISGNGAAFGYWGGLLALGVMLLFFSENTEGLTLLKQPPAFNLDAAAREGTRFVGPFIAIWYAVFMLPFFFWVKDEREQSRSTTMRATLSELRQSLVAVAKNKSMFNFLLSSMFYRDALSALYAAGGIFAVLVLDWSMIEIGVFGILSGIAAAIFTQIGGIFDSKIGPKPVIRFCCIILILVTTAMILVDREGFAGVVPFAVGSKIPDVVFYICGAAIGGAGGAIYAASRSLMCRHTPDEHPSQAFGLFSLAGRATAFLAPFLIGLFTYMTGSLQLGYLPVILLFGLGLYLLTFVKAEGEKGVWNKKAE